MQKYFTIPILILAIVIGVLLMAKVLAYEFRSNSISLSATVTPMSHGTPVPWPEKPKAIQSK